MVIRSTEQPALRSINC